MIVQLTRGLVIKIAPRYANIFYNASVAPWMEIFPYALASSGKGHGCHLLDRKLGVR